MRMYKRSAILQALTQGLTYAANSVISDPDGNTGAYGFGYFAGGASTIDSAKVDKLNFNTEISAGIVAGLSVTRNYPSGTNSTVKGYLAGSFSPTINSVDGVTFASDTIASLSAVLTAKKSDTAGASSGLKGYVGGGANDSNVMLTKIDAILFSNDTITSITNGLSTARQRLGAVNSFIDAYFAGGFNTNYSFSNMINGLNFSTEIVTTTTAVLSVARTGLTGVSSSFKGYFNCSSPSQVDGIVFSTLAVINPVASLVTLAGVTGGVNSSARGYFGGGGGGSLSKIDRLDFTTEVVKTLTSILSQGRQGLTGVSYKTAAPNVVGTGFYAGLSPAGKLINKIVFSTTVSTTSAATLSVGRYKPSSLVNSDKGYICGGTLSSTPWASAVIDKLSFISETLASLSAVISIARSGVCGLSASSAGYNLGGSNPLNNVTSTKIDKFIYSTEANTALATTLSAGHGYGLPMISNVAGYGAGGWTGTASSTLKIDKLLYSTEALSVLAATLISVAQANGCGGAQSTTKGYSFIGNGSAAVNGLTFSTETAFVGTNALAAIRSNSATTSNSETAYIAGGVSTGNDTNITSYVFANETCVSVSNVLQTTQSHAIGLSYN